MKQTPTTITRSYPWHGWAAVALLVALPGCKEKAPPAPIAEIQASELPEITVNKDKKMLLTHATAQGSFATVDTLDKVPKDRHGWVRVVDLAIKPSRRMDHELVYVADLRSAREDGSYPYVVMSRAAFESAALGRAKQGATDPAPTPGSVGTAAHGQVILYTTDWCGVCKTARAFLDEKGVGYVEKDIEKDQQAAAELLQKAKAAGISTSGVPVIDVGGTLMQGFDAARLTELLANLPKEQKKKL